MPKLVNSTLKTADLLQAGQCAIIQSLETTELCVRLLQMGCLPGKPITHIRSAIGGSPLYFQVGTQFFALRKEEAALITVLYSSS